MVNVQRKLDKNWSLYVLGFIFKISVIYNYLQ